VLVRLKRIIEMERLRFQMNTLQPPV